MQHPKTNESPRADSHSEFARKPGESYGEYYNRLLITRTELNVAIDKAMYVASSYIDLQIAKRKFNDIQET